jgi:hypothetical protein
MENYKKFNNEIILFGIEQTDTSYFVPHSAEACPTKDILKLISHEEIDFILSEVKRLTKARIEFVTLWGTEGLLDTINHLDFYHLKHKISIQAELIINQGSETWDEDSELIKEMYALKPNEELAFPEKFNDGNVLVFSYSDYEPESNKDNIDFEKQEKLKKEVYIDHVKTCYPEEYQGYFLPNDNA